MTNTATTTADNVSEAVVDLGYWPIDTPANDPRLEQTLAYYEEAGWMAYKVNTDGGATLVGYSDGEINIMVVTVSGCISSACRFYDDPIGHRLAIATLAVEL